MSHLWPQLPHDQAAYSEISSDFWPWPEVFADLKRRDHFSGALEVRQNDRRARFFWADGEALGGYSDNSEDDLVTLALHFPRGSLSLYLLDSQVARLAWQCRDTTLQGEEQRWEDLQTGRTLQAFSGVIRGPAGDSYWHAGQHLHGPLARAGERVTLIAAPREVVSTESVIEFYNTALNVAARHFDVAAHWRASALELADDHLCLDPFAREVVYESGQLQLVQSVPADELLAALRDAYALTLVRAGRRAGELPLDALHGHSLWAQSGLGEQA
ncbi:hypothetical protein [Deinococcus peraridilitoris]|uniref:Uncharacterized protein n=1 Tax=Deinococcus peraridilitoris (strain DSM 19664 / LMG 22246 / CIP 109416 / KR-200) TaxID=937777 RepID=L0A6I8_DEIPD|nr:hypothetical protein [Deinococcus peraridilitoris]AFZ68610.1 hypothetical protein Deipe_3165 [Deinococcus peraridilitoris DSM 19664]